jgi:hypothetical protein
MIPTVTPIVRGLVVSWTDQPVPADLEFYRVYYGESSPPSILFGDTAGSQVIIQNLTPGVLYYVQVFAFDCFGPGQGSGISSGIPLDDVAADSGGSVSGGVATLTMADQDVLTITVTTEVGNLVYIWACADFADAAAAIGTLVGRRQASGGGSALDLRESAVYVPGSSLRVTGHLSFVDSPPAGTWEYVLRARGSVDGIALTNAYIDMLVQR